MSNKGKKVLKHKRN